MWLVPGRRRAAAQARRGRQPGVDRRRAAWSIDVERDEDRTTRLAVVDVDDPWPRRLATEHGDLDAHGDEGDADVSPDGTEVAYTFTPRADLNRSSEIRVAERRRRARCARLTGAPDMHDGGPRVVARRRDDRLRLGARAASTSCTWSDADGADDRQLTSAGADHAEHAWHPDGDAPRRRRAGERNRFDARARRRRDGGAAERRRRGRRVGRARSGPPPAT